MKAQTVTLLGMNRTAASIGLRLKQMDKLNLTVVGYDGDKEALDKAMEMGAVDQQQWKLISAVKAGDIIVVTTPSSALRQMFELIGRDVQSHALVLDFSNLKSLGQKWARQHLVKGHHVGAVPVLATHSLLDGEQGVGSARPDLFENSVVCYMPSPKAEAKAVETAVQFGRLLGATPFFIDAEEYDSLAQGVRVLPGLAGGALFRAMTKAAGWRDMMRFAGVPFAQATLPLVDEADIAHRAFYDKEATLHWLDAFIEEMQGMRRWVYEGDVERMSAYMEQLSIERQRWLGRRKANNWEEKIIPEYEPPTFAQQMLGNRLGGSRDEE